MAVMRWVGSWTTSPAALDGERIENRTLRMIMRPTLSGDRVRVRFSNAHGGKPLIISKASLALRQAGARIDADSAAPLTFGGEPAIRIPAGALAVSDTIAFELKALADVAVTFHVPGLCAEPTGHKMARQTSYISPPGDFTGASQWPEGGEETQSWFFATGVEAQAETETRGIVCLGDSLTDANISTPDANARWPDQLARRLVAAYGDKAGGIMNQGTGGNRLLHDRTGYSALRRFDRDVLAQPGVTHMIALIGVNDLRNRWGGVGEEAQAAPMIAGYRQLARRAKAAGVKAIVCTLLPYENETFFAGGWTEQREDIRQAINAWLREQDEFDALIDLDKALRDPAAPTKLALQWDCGDHLHPSDAGYLKMGDVVWESGEAA